MPAVYVILGLPGSGRHEIVSHLIESVSPDAPSVSVYQASTDAAATPRFNGASVALIPFQFGDGHFSIAAGAEPLEEPETVFFFTDGRKSPIDQLEAYPAWLQARGWELSRILLVVNCALAVTQPKVEQWYDDCAHFADVILLNRRDATSHAWAQQFQKKCAQNRYPCLVLPVKNGEVDNPLLVLFPEARRLSLVFDKIDPIDELDLDEENLPDEPFALENKPDPYFERLPNGQRRKLVPDVTEFLPK